MSFMLLKLLEMLLFSGRISGIIIAGGYDGSPDGSSSVDILAGDLDMKQLPNLPHEIGASSMVAHFGTILFCGGSVNEQKSLKLDNGTWKEHSTLNVERAWHSAVTTQTATFIFGGCYSDQTYEYLLKDSTRWLMGKTEIPGGFMYGCAIAVKSDQEIWLIGGWQNERRILTFNINDHTFQVLPFQLNVGRIHHRCAFIQSTNKIMLTGGYDNGYLDSTEILDTEGGKVTMVSSMNSKRAGHGIGVVTINGEDRLAVFGGFDERTKLDSVELYNSETEKWETSDLKLSEARPSFSCLTVKLGDIILHF